MTFARTRHAREQQYQGTDVKTQRTRQETTKDNEGNRRVEKAEPVQGAVVGNAMEIGRASCRERV